MQVPQASHSLINRLDYDQLRVIMELHGFCVMYDETEETLREEVRANVMDGIIDIDYLLFARGV